MDGYKNLPIWLRIANFVRNRFPILLKRNSSPDIPDQRNNNVRGPGTLFMRTEGIRDLARFHGISADRSVGDRKRTKRMKIRREGEDRNSREREREE